MMRERLIKALGKQRSNLPVMVPITLLCPRWYLREMFALIGPQSPDWGGKEACVTLSFDCDYREDVEAYPQVLKILEAYPFKTSFACIGKWIEQYPDEHRGIVEAGHEILNHSYRHPDNEELGVSERFNQLSDAEIESEIVECHAVCQHYLGVAPTGFRIPHFGVQYTPAVYPILKKLGYSYSSSIVAAESRTLGAPFVEEHGIVEFPVSPCPEHPFGILDTHHALRKKRAWHTKPGTFLALFQELLAIGMQSHAHINLYFDPRDVARWPDEIVPVFDWLAERYGSLHILTYTDMIQRFSFS